MGLLTCFLAGAWEVTSQLRADLYRIGSLKNKTTSQRGLLPSR